MPPVGLEPLGQEKDLRHRRLNAQVATMMAPLATRGRVLWGKHLQVFVGEVVTDADRLHCSANHALVIRVLAEDSAR